MKFCEQELVSWVKFVVLKNAGHIIQNRRKIKDFDPTDRLHCERNACLMEHKKLMKGVNPGESFGWHLLAITSVQEHVLRGNYNALSRCMWNFPGLRTKVLLRGKSTLLFTRAPKAFTPRQIHWNRKYYTIPPARCNVNTSVSQCGLPFTSVKLITLKYVVA